jgi:hypothetical protein
MKKTALKPNSKKETVIDPRLTLRAKHAFQWSRASVATCSCKGWTVWEFSLPYAKRNHRHHIAGLPPDKSNSFVRKDMCA